MEEGRQVGMDFHKDNERYLGGKHKSYSLHLLNPFNAIFCYLVSFHLVSTPCIILFHVIGHFLI